MKSHRDDEEHHRDIGIEHEALQALAFKLFSDTIKIGCKAAIAVSSQI